VGIERHLGDAARPAVRAIRFDQQVDSIADPPQRKRIRAAAIDRLPRDPPRLGERTAFQQLGDPERQYANGPSLPPNPALACANAGGGTGGALGGIGRRAAVARNPPPHRRPRAVTARARTTAPLESAPMPCPARRPTARGTTPRAGRRRDRDPA